MKERGKHYYSASFKLGDRVVVSDTETGLWDMRGEILEERPAKDTDTSASCIRLSCRKAQLFQGDARRVRFFGFDAT